MTKIAYCYDEETKEYAGSMPVEPNEYTNEYNPPKNSTNIEPTEEKCYFRDGKWVLGE